MIPIPLQVPGLPELVVILFVLLVPLALLGGLALLVYTLVRRQGRVSELEDRVDELERGRTGPE